MGNKGHVFGVRTFTDSKNTLLGTCPEMRLLKKEQVYHFFFFWRGGGVDCFSPERVY